MESHVQRSHDRGSVFLGGFITVTVKPAQTTYSKLLSRPTRTDRNKNTCSPLFTRPPPCLVVLAWNKNLDLKRKTLI